MKFAPEGYPFIIGALLLSGVAAIIFFWVIRNGNSPLVISFTLLSVGISLVIVCFMAFFFRDPDRDIPEGQGLFVSPADGKVIGIRDVSDKQFIGTEAKEISIFMSPLDVHVNRSPCDGKVVAVRYSPGAFTAAYRDDASLRNENIVMIIENTQGKILVRQVAGFIARRAVCRVGEGAVLKRGDRFGIIKFSSRVDVYLPKHAEIRVNLGDKVKAGESIIAVNNR